MKPNSLKPSENVFNRDGLVLRTVWDEGSFSALLVAIISTLEIITSPEVVLVR